MKNVGEFLKIKPIRREYFIYNLSNYKTFFELIENKGRYEFRRICKR